MASETFERRLDVSSNNETCWATLTDVEQLTSWVSILHEAREIVRLESYTAVLKDRLGPLSLRADMDIQVEVLAEGKKLRAFAEGRDPQVSSQIKVDVIMVLEPIPAGTSFGISGNYQVLGRVASMGGGIIRKKADKILEEFFTHAESVLGTLSLNT